MPAAPRPRDAIRLVLATFGPIIDCVTDRRLTVQPPGYDPEVLYTLAFDRTADPAPLRAKAGGPSGLLLDVRHTFAIVRVRTPDGRLLWRTSTRAYQYRILDSRQTELLVFHWQPGAVERGPDHPHLHVSAAVSAHVSATRRRSFPLDRLHTPTGRVSLEAVVRYLIAEWGVAYRHRDWANRLARSEAVFRQEMTQRP